MKLEKIEKLIGKDTAAELEALSVADLDKRIADAQDAIKLAKEELDANPKYQELKESINALRSGLREVKARQNAITQYCLNLRDQHPEGHFGVLAIGDAVNE